MGSRDPAQDMILVHVVVQVHWAPLSLQPDQD